MQTVACPVKRGALHQPDTAPLRRGFSLGAAMVRLALLAAVLAALSACSHRLPDDDPSGVAYFGQQMMTMY